MSVKKDRQDEVAAALVPLLKHSDIRTPRAAAKALGVWGTKDSITPLSDALKANDPFTRFEAMGALGKLKNEDGIKLVAEHLIPPQDRFQASKVLQAAGPAAEAPVATYLTHQDWTVRNEACKVLGAVGTKKSLDALEKAAKSDDNFIIRTEAGKAVTAIKNRNS